MSIATGSAVFVGILVAVQAAIIGAFGTRLNPYVASMWVHAGGLVFGIIGVAVARLGFHVDVVRHAPWGLLAGVAGFLLVGGIAVAVSGIGLASTLAIVTGVQLLVGFTLESTGVLGRVVVLDPIRLVGAVLMIAGVYLVVSRGPGV